MSTNPQPPGAPHSDDHDGLSGPPPQDVIARGYEADVYDARTVLSVPFLVILFFVIAFAVVSAIFYFIAYPKPNPKANPLAVERNDVPLNDRLERIDRGPKNGSGQPRLEPLRLRSGNPRVITRPELPVADGNSPELHPEDLWVTPERFPALFVAGGGRYGLDRTMGLDDKVLEKLFPVQKSGTAPLDSHHVPTASNAGRGAAGSLVVPPGSANPQPPAPAPPPDHKGGH